MSKWEVIKNLNYKQISALLVWFLKHPFFMFATFKATIHTLRIAEKEFPKTHGLHNKANAFRHAIWNTLIAQECAKFSSDVDKVLAWTKQITDWHEEFSPNEKMAKLMDLHNNNFGREKFTIYQKMDRHHIVRILKQELQSAFQINKIDDFARHKDKLVYLKT